MVLVPFKVVPSAVSTLLPAFLQNVPYLEYRFPKISNIYLGRDINSVSELYE
jgi:hypothetical protein